jgi:protein gp37
VDRVFDTMELANWHTFQVLTKRIEHEAAPWA